LDEFSFLVQLVAGGKGFFKGYAAVWCVEVEDIDTGATEFGKGFIEGCFELLWLVVAGLGWIAFSS